MTEIEKDVEQSAPDMAKTVSKLRGILFTLVVILAIESFALGALGYPALKRWMQKQQAQAVPGVSKNIVYSANTEKKIVALTFDDGPFPYEPVHKTNHTKDLVEVLAKINVKASFFIVGKKAEASPELVKAEFDAGHCIANHTYNHPQSGIRLPDMTPEALEVELGKQSDLIQRITGQRPRFFRPPGEVSDPKVVNAAKKLGMLVVFNKLNPGDWKYDGKTGAEKDAAVKTIEDIVLAEGAVKPGTIILMHDGIPATREALPKIVTTLRERGYEFVTLEQMFPAGG